MITEFFERLLTSNRGSRDDVKRRLKLVLAHDRSTLNASTDRKSTRLNSSHSQQSRMPSSA